MYNCDPPFEITGRANVAHEDSASYEYHKGIVKEIYPRKMKYDNYGRRQMRRFLRIHEKHKQNKYEDNINMEAIGKKIVECVMKDFLEDINSKVSGEELQKIKSLIEDFKSPSEPPSVPSISPHEIPSAPSISPHEIPIAPSISPHEIPSAPSISPPVVPASTPSITIPETDNPMKKERISLTMGDAGENHAGMEMVGDLMQPGSGFTMADLYMIKIYMEKIYNLKCEMVVMSRFGIEAGTLIIREFVKETSQIQIYKELNTFKWCTKYYCTRRNKVLNKHARSNTILLEGIEQEPDYENKKGRIVDSNKLETLASEKKRLVEGINMGLDSGSSETKKIPYIMEGNRYFDLKKCGIGLHGDKERTRVICLSIGADNYPMRWVWFHKSKPIAEPYDVRLNSGDVYIMSEAAVGQKWMSSSLYTLRHAAGSEKYTNLDKYKK